MADSYPLTQGHLIEDARQKELFKKYSPFLPDCFKREPANQEEAQEFKEHKSNIIRFEDGTLFNFLGGFEFIESEKQKEIEVVKTLIVPATTTKILTQYHELGDDY